MNIDINHQASNGQSIYPLKSGISYLDTPPKDKATAVQNLPLYERINKKSTASDSRDKPIFLGILKVFLITIGIIFFLIGLLWSIVAWPFLGWLGLMINLVVGTLFVLLGVGI